MTYNSEYNYKYTSICNARTFIWELGFFAFSLQEFVIHSNFRYLFYCCHYFWILLPYLSYYCNSFSVFYIIFIVVILFYYYYFFFKHSCTPFFNYWNIPFNILALFLCYCNFILHWKKWVFHVKMKLPRTVFLKCWNFYKSQFHQGKVYKLSERYCWKKTRGMVEYFPSLIQNGTTRCPRK